ncbi:MAG: MEDS domain-containing protein [Chloroflexota bacterium]|nr:MEDS domain-containing protein [Dehalococcoidia bacterium]MDW8252608.1 MEDS domain-containing protein [Chloroflexota bacterium]
MRADGVTQYGAVPRLRGRAPAPGDLLCAIVDSPEDQLAATVAFLSDGLARGERGVLLADRRFVDHVWAALPSSPAVAMERQPVEPVTNRDYVLREWTFDSDTAVALAERAVEAARAAGYAGARICVDMTWALRPTGSPEQIGRFAEGLGAVLAKRAAVALLLYDRVRFPPHALEAALRAHPLIVRSGCIVPNHYFVPLPDRRNARRSVDRMLLSLDRLVDSASSALLLSAVLDALPQGVVLSDAGGVIRLINRAAAALLASAPERLIGAPLPALFAESAPPDGWPASPGPDRRNLRLRRGDGSALWTRAVAQRLDDGAGGFVLALDPLPQTQPTPLAPGSASGRAPASPLLVVSGDPTLSEALALQLIAEGYSVLVAESAGEAAELLGSAPIEMAIVDFDPFSDSGETIRALRAGCPTLPIILLVSQFAQRDGDPAVARMVSAVVPKPFSRAELRRVVRRLMGEQDAAPPEDIPTPASP